MARAFLTPFISECRSLIDLMVVIDGSDSITFADYDKLRYALAHIIPDLDLGPRRIRLGFIVYSTNIAQVRIVLIFFRSDIIEGCRGRVVRAARL